MDFLYGSLNRWAGRSRMAGRGYWPAYGFAVALLCISACSAEDPGEPAEVEAPPVPTVDEVPTGPTADDATPGQAAEAETLPGPEAGDETADNMPSLEDLLPEQFALITRPWYGDLDGMIERRAIRVLVVSGGPQYFYYGGKPRGIVVELLARFRQALNEELGRGLDAVEIVPMPVSRDRLIPALLAGKADLIAADMTITDLRSEQVDFSTPLVRNINEVLVFRSDASQTIASLDELAGQSIYVQASSSYFEHLARLNEEFVEQGLDAIDIQPADELLRPQDIIEMVNAGLVNATVLDSYRANFWKQVFPEIEVRSDLAVNSGADIAWAFRKDSPQLAEAVNGFVREHRKGTLIGNILLKRYLKNAEWVRNATNDVSLEQLRPYLELFESAAAIAKLDPLMLVAQAYQESGLDHSKVSPVGAMGIMQIKPSTAADKNVGYDDISSLTDNVHAGATYMRFLMDRYFSDEGMDSLHQWLFALAAYNAGPAKVRRLRRQAEAEGHDPDLWLENVELIAARKIGRETVNYVRNIFTYYVAYRMAWEERRLRQANEEDPLSGFGEEPSAD